MHGTVKGMRAQLCLLAIGMPHPNAAFVPMLEDKAGKIPSRLNMFHGAFRPHHQEAYGRRNAVFEGVHVMVLFKDREQPSRRLSV